jgi:hypothetical protein
MDDQGRVTAAKTTRALDTVVYTPFSSEVLGKNYFFNSFEERPQKQRVLERNSFV